MQRTYSKDLPACSGKKTIVSGWVEETRTFGGLKFIILRDKEGTCQITVPKKAVSEEIFNNVDAITKESVILAEGLVKESKQARLGVELIPEKLEIVSLAGTPTPIDMSGKIASDLSVRLDYRFLDLRDEKRRAIFKIRSKVYKFCCEYFDKEGFTNINTPKITSAGVESGAELFEVKYFDKKAYLAQSPQIYKQMMVAAGFEKVYELGAVFRAEKSHTTRHVTEFTGLDLEQGFIESEQEVMDTVDGLMKYLIKRVNEECPKELELLGIKLTEPKQIPRITMKEAEALLKKEGLKLSEFGDLDSEGEKSLGKIIKEKYDSDFVFVCNYPWSIRPFYHMRPENDAKGTKSFDLIWNGTEIATGAQREHRYEILKKQAKEKGLDLDRMEDYANIFKYGCPAHGGCGLGLDRIIECMLKLDNIREAILLPRDTERLKP